MLACAARLLGDASFASPRQPEASESDPLLLLDPASLHLLSSLVFFFSSPTLTSWPPSSSPHLLLPLLLPLFLPLFLSSPGWAGPIPERSVRPSFHSRISTVRPEDHRPGPVLPPGPGSTHLNLLRPEPAASRWTRTYSQKQAQPVPVQKPSRSLG